MLKDFSSTNKIFNKIIYITQIYIYVYIIEHIF